MKSEINPRDTNVLHKEIDLIQSVISRMANNSFLVKGWSITLFTGIFAFMKGELFTSAIFLIGPVLILASIGFWYIDSFFLHKEKCYRVMYEDVISLDSTCKGNTYSLDYRPYANDVESIGEIMKNKTVMPFYLTPIFLNSIVILYTFLKA